MTSKIVALWSIPRSVSTAFEKTFSQRPDTVIVHEPFTDSYYFSRERRSNRYGDHDELITYDGNQAITDIKGALPQNGTASMVFFKDLAFQAYHYLTDEFLGQTTNTFMIRHPAAVMASLLPLKPDFTEEEFGFMPLQEIWQRVTRLSTQDPIVVEGDRFRQFPEEVLRRYCDRIGVEFNQDMLEWEDGRIRDWEPHEALSHAKWHKTLESSHGILPANPLPDIDIDSDHREMFERAIAIYEKIAPYTL